MAQLRHYLLPSRHDTAALEQSPDQRPTRRPTQRRTRTTRTAGCGAGLDGWPLRAQLRTASTHNPTLSSGPQPMGTATSTTSPSPVGWLRGGTTGADAGAGATGAGGGGAGAAGTGNGGATRRGGAARGGAGRCGETGTGVARRGGAACGGAGCGWRGTGNGTGAARGGSGGGDGGRVLGSSTHNKPDRLLPGGQGGLHSRPTTDCPGGHGSALATAGTATVVAPVNSAANISRGWTMLCPPTRVDSGSGPRTQ